MEAEAPHAEASQPEPSSVSGSTHTIPQQTTENTELLIPSFRPPSAPSSPTTTSTLSRLGLKSPTSPSAPAPGSPGGGQVSAITVVALLDKLVNMMEAVQDNQHRMEQRQADLEGAVRVVQGDVTRLSKTHISTSNSVSKLLERSRKMSGHLKEVRERLDKQAVQVKKLEANHSHLLKRNHFKVLIFQEDNEIPSSVFVKDSLKTPQPSQYDAESTLPNMSVASSVDGIHTQEEGLQTISLSSDDDDELSAHRAEGHMMEHGAAGTSQTFERRSDKFKRSSLKKVDSLKKSIEKKMAQITTKIVPPEKREKIMKSLSPTHPKSPSTKSSSFKVSPMTFNVKKVRDGEIPSQDLASGGEAHVEIPPLESLDRDTPLAAVHTLEGAGEKSGEMLNRSTSDDIKAELSINGEPTSIQCELNGDRSAGLAVPERDDDVGEEEEEEEEDENHKTEVKTAANVQTPTETVVVEQAS
ncbi:caveolae-associated protein 2-like [Dunckerocampus dactyliophorus]|uniref:caveolae-associated protein 2-like n=1 Tax=Dunckerocampus dactyliophorus TaxID=161453 RepID=UPI002404D4AF|nr:caveolae-associated protein 2-like [Dunckerocampus dactyliophorus]